VYPIPSTIVDYQFVLDENFIFGMTDFADMGNRNLSTLIDIAAFSLHDYFLIWESRFTAAMSACAQDVGKNPVPHLGCS
jgi:hypothetical protein